MQRPQRASDNANPNCHFMFGLSGTHLMALCASGMIVENKNEVCSGKSGDP
jgi:hypothetical protein